MSKLSLSVVALSTSIALAGVAQAGVIGVSADHSQFLFGTGRDVVVGVVDTGIDRKHPTLGGAVIKSKDFFNGKGGDIDGHGTAVTSLIAGNHPNFRGAAPDAKILNARWITTTGDRQVEPTRGLLWSVRNGADIVNMSLGGFVARPRIDKRNLIVDYLTEKFDTTIVVASGNESSSALRVSPSASFNGLTVGALLESQTSWNRVTSFSNRALGSDARTKPEVTAPGQNVRVAAHDWESGADYTAMDGTSFSAPIVAGVAAQMVGWAKENDKPASPTLIKAILMSSAVKVHDFNGDVWSPREQRFKSSGVTQFRKSLDDEQGAGRIQAVHAYHLFSKTEHEDQRLGNWKHGKMGRGETVKMGLGDLQAGERVDASLTWLRHIIWDDEDGDQRPDFKDRYSIRKPLADFALRLFRDGELIAESDSLDDNFEHISWTIEQDGRYQLRARRFDRFGIKNEEFALAARVLDNPPILNDIGPVPFGSSLAQFMPSAGMGKMSLSSYIGGAGPSLTAVPEPSSAALLVLLAPLLGRRRRA